jgi:hypothetical protein
MISVHISSVFQATHIRGKTASYTLHWQTEMDKGFQSVCHYQMLLGRRGNLIYYTYSEPSLKTARYRCNDKGEIRLPRLSFLPSPSPVKGRTPKAAITENLITTQFLPAYFFPGIP